MPRRHVFPLVYRLRWGLMDLLLYMLLAGGVIYGATRCIQEHGDLVRLSAWASASTMFAWGVSRRVLAHRATRAARRLAAELGAALPRAFRIEPCLVCYDASFTALQVVGPGRSVQYACGGCAKRRWAPALTSGAARVGERVIAFDELVAWCRRLRGDPDFAVPLAGAVAAAPLPFEETRREPIPPELRRHVLERDGWRCQECGAASDLQLDHIVPVANGGSNTLANLQLLCGSCNRKKGARA